jgi:hypothetical protein
MSIELRDRIERRPIDSLVPYARNSRTHSDEQIQQLVESMRSVRRWQEFAGGIAILADTGQTFGQVAAQRGVPEI